MEISKFEYENTKCIICGESNYELLYDIRDRYKEGSLTFVRCKNDGLIYQNPIPTENSMEMFFNSTSFSSQKKAKQAEELTGYFDYLGGEKFRFKLAEKRYKLVRLFSKKKGQLSILKIAPGTGTFLKLAQDKGDDVLGVDISDFFVNYAVKEYGINMIRSSFEEADLGSRKFDVILFLGAISNVRNPKFFFNKIKNHLKEDGQFHTNYITLNSSIAKLQKNKYWLFRPPVLNIFNEQNFIQMLKNEGFKVEYHKSEWQYSNVSKIVHFSKIKSVIKVADILNLKDKIIKIPIPGGKYVIVSK